MAELREVFEMATKQMEPDQDAWREQEQRQRRASRRRKLGAFAVAAVIGVAVIAALIANVGTDRGEAVPAGIAPPEPGLYAVNIETGALGFIQDPGPDAYPFIPSPDGTKIAYTNLVDGQRRVFVMEADGSQTRQVQHDGPAAGGDLSWSPDSSRIGFSGEVDGVARIYELDVSSGAVHRLTDERVDVGLPEWSSDGSTLSYTVLAGVPRLKTMDLSSGQTEDFLASELDVWNAAWAPDGHAIAYVKRTVTGTEARELWMVEPDGSDPHRLLTAQNRGLVPLWSPDGSRIAWVNLNSGTYGDGVFETLILDPATGTSSEATLGFAEGWLDDDTLIVGFSPNDVEAANA